MIAVVPRPKRRTLGKERSSVVPRTRRDEAAHVEHAAPEIVGCGRRLAAPRVVGIGEDDVGEGTADVDADAGARRAR